MQKGYSNNLKVLEFLVRVKPFTDTFLKMNAQPEAQDRTFQDFAGSWQNMTRVNGQDNNELIPEFYYMPEVYMNKNCISLSSKNPNFNIDCIYIPPWALNAFDLVRIMRESLESKYVTDHLNDWLQLIFGTK